MKSSPLLCIRSMDINQASPFLEIAWKKIKKKNPDSLLILKDQPENLTTSIDTALIEHSGPGVNHDVSAKKLISWSVPNERTLEDITLFKDVEAVPGPVNAVYKLADKRATKMLFEQFSLPTPKWEVLDREFTHGELLKESFRNKIEHDLISHLELPVILKPLWDCMGHGIKIIANQGDLINSLRKSERKTILIESFINGSLGCIEIIGTPGAYFSQPPCYTGRSANGVRSDFDTIRVCHPDFFKTQLNDAIKYKLYNLLSHLNFSGACCVDFIVRDNEIFFLEINPRISGISCLSSAASGINSFEAMFIISEGQWRYNAIANQVNMQAALQVGGIFADELSTYIQQDKEITVFRDDMINVDGSYSRNIIAGGDTENIEEVLNAIDHLSLGLIPREQLAY